jgi:putative aldouronate transport system substrate-binding protein
MGIPWYNPKTGTQTMLWARQDWLDKVGLPFPDTLEQVYEVGMAFKKEGLAQHGMWVANVYAGQWGDMSLFFGAYGNPPRLWKRGSNGLAYTSLELSVKETLALLAKWYKDGFFDPEFLASQDVTKYVGGNLVGMFSGAYWNAVWPIPDSVTNDPDAKWKPGQCPAGPGGKRGRYGETGAGIVAAFKKGINPLKVEAYIETQNWLYEIMAKSEYPITIPPWAIKGYDYDVDAEGNVVAGKFITQDYGAGGFDDFAMRFADIQDKPANKFIELSQKNPEDLNPLQAYAVSNPNYLLQQQAYLLNIEFDYNVATDFIWTLPTDVAELTTSLNTLEAEAFASIITGKQPVDYFDTFVSEWKKQGGDQLTEVVNEVDAKNS